MTLLTNKRVVILGASSGIGWRIAELFAEHGAQQVIAARRVDNLEKLAATTGAVARRCDITDHDDVKALAIGKIVEFARDYSYIGPIYMYSLLDTGTNLADPEDNFGLLHTNFTTKLAWGIWLLAQDDLETLLNTL